MRDELMSEIIKLEWDMFSHVSNVGGPVSTQPNIKIILYKNI